jgi:D-3-phosphoglycerate dehydrogenase
MFYLPSIETLKYTHHITQGLARFPTENYEIREDWENNNAHAILLRSHKLQESEVDVSVRAIARCGAGTNNVPVARMSELGIPVFNTPGANANAVKELVLCGLFLGSRRLVAGINHMKQLGEQGLQKERVEKDKAIFGGREIAGKTLAVIGLGHIGAATAREASALGMKTVGYDPALSIDSALKLPREISIADSISSAVSSADYISLNIPYIKGDGGTHGIIGKDVLSHMKNDAVLLNFARGELVDSEAMKDFLDKGDGRYISDFPDDLLWNHKNVILLPHLGASTEEAEETAVSALFYLCCCHDEPASVHVSTLFMNRSFNHSKAAMAADTIRLYLEHGTIRNSVNFPAASLPERKEGSIRVPGMLAFISDVFAKHGINILQQINTSRGDIAYNVIDVELGHEAIDLKDLQKELTMREGVLSSRILFGVAGAGYARNVDGKYFV